MPRVESKPNQQTFTREESYQYHQGKLPQTAKSALALTHLRGWAKDACLLGIQACCNMASGDIAKDTGKRLLTFREFLARNKRYSRRGRSCLDHGAWVPFYVVRVCDPLRTILIKRNRQAFENQKCEYERGMENILQRVWSSLSHLTNLQIIRTTRRIMDCLRGFPIPI